MTGLDDESATLLAEYLETIAWAKARLRGHHRELRRLAFADPRTYTKANRELVKAVLLYGAARVMVDDV